MTPGKQFALVPQTQPTVGSLSTLLQSDRARRASSSSSGQNPAPKAPPCWGNSHQKTQHDWNRHRRLRSPDTPDSHPPPVELQPRFEYRAIRAHAGMPCPTTPRHAQPRKLLKSASWPLAATLPARPAPRIPSCRATCLLATDHETHHFTPPTLQSAAPSHPANLPTSTQEAGC